MLKVLGIIFCKAISGRMLSKWLGASATVCFAMSLSVQGIAQQAPNSGFISGSVSSGHGAEVGVWVIAETDDLATHFTKIVVTDEQGRFVLPELPEALFKVWVRGYGLVDSEPVQLRTGAEDVELRAFVASDPALAAQVYPANYWYSLLEVPSENEFPGTGGDGNGIGEMMFAKTDG